MKKLIITSLMLIATAVSLKAQNEISSADEKNITNVSDLLHEPESAVTNINRAYLEQVPAVSVHKKNTMKCYIPSETEWVFVSIFNSEGIEILTTCLASKGKVEIPVDAASLSAGHYSCSLEIDGKTVDSKELIVTR
mgnify:CR=1 FL=1